MFRRERTHPSRLNDRTCSESVGSAASGGSGGCPGCGVVPGGHGRQTRPMAVPGQRRSFGHCRLDCPIGAAIQKRLILSRPRCRSLAHGRCGDPNAPGRRVAYLPLHHSFQVLSQRGSPADDCHAPMTERLTAVDAAIRAYSRRVAPHPRFWMHRPSSVHVSVSTRQPMSTLGNTACSGTLDKINITQTLCY